MSTMTRSSHPATTSSQTLAALARADALRFARHPLFVLGFGAWVAILAVKAWNHSVVTVGLEDPTTFVAFLVGVFGFVVAHRLTTALRRSGDLADTAPVSSQRRTLALCLACLVPMTAGAAITLAFVVFGSLWPPSLPGGHVAWFGYEPDHTVWAILIGDVVIACLGGPLLGVAVARWAPFRGSALLGMVLLLFTVMSAMSLPTPWYVISPWTIFQDEHVTNGKYQVSWVRDGVSPVWWCGYAACLCGLAVVAALLRDRAHRRPLLVTGGVLTAVAVGCLLLAMA